MHEKATARAEKALFLESGLESPNGLIKWNGIERTLGLRICVRIRT